MSGEFGSCDMFFHEKIRGASADAEDGRYEITRAWGKVLAAIAPVAKAISWAEASDSSQESPLRESVAQMPAIREALAHVEDLTEAIRDEAIAVMLATNQDRLPEPTMNGEIIELYAPRLSGLKDHEYSLWREALTRYVTEWYRKSGKYRTWKLRSYGGAAGGSGMTYRFEPATSDEAARRSMLAIKAALARHERVYGEEVNSIVQRWDESREATR